MTPLDWVVLVAYLVGIIAFGMWAGRGSREMNDFFLAGRSMRWWAIGLSVMATQISAITFVGTTGQAYTDGMRFLVVYFGLPFAMVILCATLVPFFYRARVFTAYEYLEQRFDARTRTLTSLLFLFGRGLSVGVTLYAPSLVLSRDPGLERDGHHPGDGPLHHRVRGLRRQPLGDLDRRGADGAHLVRHLPVLRDGDRPAPGERVVRRRPGPRAGGRAAATPWTPRSASASPTRCGAASSAGTFLALAYFGTDQSQVQRYLSGASLTQSRLSLLFNAFLKVPMQFLILLTGVLVFVFYHFHAAAAAVERARRWRGWSARRRRRSWPPCARASRARTSSAGRRRRRWRRDRGLQAPYLEAQRAMDAARGEAVALTRRVLGGDYNDTNYIFPTYILSTLRGGLAGLVIAVIFAAAMSTLSGELNSLATASMVDFYKRFVRPQATPAQDLFMSRVLTAVWGGVRGAWWRCARGSSAPPSRP